MPDGPDSLAAFIERGPVRDLSIAVVNRTRPQPIQEMVEETFGGRSIGVDELDVPDAEADQVVLLDGDDVVATSPLAVLEDEILLVNSDLYMTGAKALGDVTLPDVFANLDETPFRVRGYPASGSEKLPLIMISRHIEQLAWEHGSGRLRSSFQRLSRLDDERGTRTVYETVGNTDVDVHVYGVPDWLPPESFPGVVHAGYDGEFRTSWFVVFHTEDPTAETAALVAEHIGDNEWDALWTFDDDRIRTINRYIERTL
ncbi:histidine kinase [Haloplanus rubicundus]|uniref:Histidine kinase n=1 Tax=Haloplanus rubicundus TaxID=1547898 RepID=A0A345E286_9EURY|nr:DICT sensory domain-containing protein [Haloplanus rubicundus]AXG06308.1 histidine kinase [Haloplanus rubicundus]